LIEQLPSPVPEARTLVACALRQRVLEDDTPVHPDICTDGDGRPQARRLRARCPG